MGNEPKATPCRVKPCIGHEKKLAVNVFQHNVRVKSCLKIPDNLFKFKRSSVRWRLLNTSLNVMTKKIGEFIDVKPSRRITIFGHTDAVGSPGYNKSLSERRANAIYAFLIRNPTIWSNICEEERWDKETFEDMLSGCDLWSVKLTDQQYETVKKEAYKDAGKPTRGPGMLVAGGHAERYAKAAYKKNIDEWSSYKNVDDKKSRDDLFKRIMESSNWSTLMKLEPNNFTNPSTFGCSYLNLKKPGRNKNAVNRRVVVFLWDGPGPVDQLKKYCMDGSVIHNSKIKSGSAGFKHCVKFCKRRSKRGDIYRCEFYKKYFRSSSCEQVPQETVCNSLDDIIKYINNKAKKTKPEIILKRIIEHGYTVNRCSFKSSSKLKILNPRIYEYFIYADKHGQPYKQYRKEIVSYPAGELAKFWIRKRMTKNGKTGWWKVGKKPILTHDFFDLNRNQVDLFKSYILPAVSDPRYFQGGRFLADKCVSTLAGRIQNKLHWKNTYSQYLPFFTYILDHLAAVSTEMGITAATGGEHQGVLHQFSTYYGKKMKDNKSAFNFWNI